RGAAGRGAPAPAPPAGAPAGAPPAADVITAGQIQQLFDGLTLSRAQGALAMADQQYIVFVPKLMKYQRLQQMHRNDRQRAIAELRSLAAPNAPQETEDGVIADKTKALDDL